MDAKYSAFAFLTKLYARIRTTAIRIISEFVFNKIAMLIDRDAMATDTIFPDIEAFSFINMYVARSANINDGSVPYTNDA